MATFSQKVGYKNRPPPVLFGFVPTGLLFISHIKIEVTIVTIERRDTSDDDRRTTSVEGISKVVYEHFIFIPICSIEFKEVYTTSLIYVISIKL